MQVSGDAGLKQSQTYPALFGWAVAHVFSHHHAEVAAGTNAILTAEAMGPEITLDELLGAEGGDAWGDAELHGVLELLMHLAQ